MPKKKSKAPKTIDVEGTAVTTEYVDRIGRLAEGYAMGGQHYRNHIKLENGLTRRGEKVTWLHELMHNLWERAGLKSYLSQKTEELVLASLDSWLWTALDDNPEAVEFLFGED